MTIKAPIQVLPTTIVARIHCRFCNSACYLPKEEYEKQLFADGPWLCTKCNVPGAGWDDEYFNEREDEIIDCILQNIEIPEK